jgi:hypothetical protein
MSQDIYIYIFFVSCHFLCRRIYVLSYVLPYILSFMSYAFVLCLFCLVEDDSLLTIVPKSTFPGLHILDHGIRQWVDVEPTVPPDNSCMIVYPGRALALITNEYVSATTHRVVRAPGQTRFSLPFLMKPNNASILRHLQSPRLSPATTAISEEEKKRSKNGYALDTCPPISFKDFRNCLGWERTQNRLARITKREAQTTAESSVFDTKAQLIPSDKGQQMVETLGIMIAHE